MKFIIYCGDFPVCLVVCKCVEQAITQMKLEKLKLVDYVLKRAKAENKHIDTLKGSIWKISSETFKVPLGARQVNFLESPFNK